jgi:hypothetical protein
MLEFVVPARIKWIEIRTSPQPCLYEGNDR